MDVQTDPKSSFRQRFIDFCELNLQVRTLELQGKMGSNPALASRWQKALESLLTLYQKAADRLILAKALTDPYLPLTMLLKLNVVEFVREPRFGDLTYTHLARIMSEHLMKRAEIFLSIRGDLRRFNKYGQLSNMRLTGSPQESLPGEGWCNYCGGCCEIRGGLPEFSGPFSPPDHWFFYFRGDSIDHQRFCPFLFEYFASAKYFCAIYKVKPKGCWEFDREECQFLKEDVSKEGAALV